MSPKDAWIAKGIQVLVLLFFKRCFYFYFTNICLCVCVNTMCMSGTHGGQKRESEPLELELRTVVSHDVSARKQVWVLYKLSQCS